MARKQHTQ